MDEKEASSLPVAAVLDHQNQIFKCTPCGRRFKRPDHLRRHIRIHTKELPYTCSKCGMAFSRSERIKSHHCRTTKGRQGILSKERRVSRACATCASSKIKCSEQKPCTRCVRHNLTCSFEANAVGGMAMEPENGDIFEETIPHSQHESHLDYTAYTNMQTSAASHSIESSDLPRIIEPYIQEPTASFNNILRMPTRAKDDSISSTTNSRELPLTKIDYMCPNTISGLFREFSSDYVNLQQIRDPFDGDSQYSIDYWDTFMGIPLSWEESLPMEMQDQADTSPATGEPEGMLRPTAISAAVEAFKASFLQWTPSVLDSLSANQVDMSFPMQLDDGSGTKIQRHNTVFPAATCKPHDRERVLETLARNGSWSVTGKLLCCFPSVSIMTELIRIFLLSHCSMKVSWIHGPTFDAGKASEPLLIAMVAFGACLTSMRAGKQIGYSLLDLIRSTIIPLWEKDNRQTRNLELLMAYSLSISLSLWSGNKRRTELAEALNQPVATIFRRAGWFRPELYETIVPEAGDNGDGLEKKWRQWIAQESRRRLAHHVFLHDAQVSMLSFNAPWLSPSEMELQLPESDLLWFSPTAQDWKMNYLRISSSYSASPSISIANAVRQTTTRCSSLFNHQYSSTSQLLLLYGLWRHTWEIRKDLDYLSGQPLEENSAEEILILRRNRLSQMLQNICKDPLIPNIVKHQTLHNVDPEVAILHSFLLLHLHCSSHDVQALAGRYGEDECNAVYPRLRQWALTPDARLAIWHATQILSTTQSMQLSSVRDFYSLVIYTAAICLFVYGTLEAFRYRKFLSRLNPGVTSEPPSLPMTLVELGKNIICLSTDSPTKIHDFICFGEGIPAIRRKETSSNPSSISIVVLSTNPTQTLQIAIESLQQCAAKTHKSKEDVLPPFAEALICLISGIAKAAQAAGFA